MSAPINIEVYSDALVVLGTAGIVVPLVRRFGLSPVLGYLEDVRNAISNANAASALGTSTRT